MHWGKSAGNAWSTDIEQCRIDTDKLASIVADCDIELYKVLCYDEQCNMGKMKVRLEQRGR